MKSTSVSCPGLICFIILGLMLSGCENINCSSKKKSRFKYYRGLSGNPEYTKTYVKKRSAHYNFGTVIQFTKLYHKFVFQNNNPDTFHIKMARTTRGGVFIKSFDKKIKHGEEGYISIIINTYSRDRVKIEEKIIVETMDKKRPFIYLYISGEVTKFATVTPQRIHLKNIGDNYLEGSTVIIPEETIPFTIRNIKARDGRYINYSFNEVKKDNKSTFLIIVKSKNNTQKYIRDILFIETSSDIQPEIPIRVRGVIKNN